MTGATNPRRALLVDYGGVLTRNLGVAFAAAEQAAGVPKGELVRVLLEAYADPSGDDFIHRFERGEIDTAGFQAAMADALRARGHESVNGAWMDQLTEGLRPDDDSAMWDLVVRARDQGIATGLLSNSWGLEGYPMDRLGACFDDLVISGEVGLRKPDPAIYQLAAERLDVVPSACAFVDDFGGNVEVANELGMFGVLHRGDVDETADRLEGFFGVSLR